MGQAVVEARAPAIGTGRGSATGPGTGGGDGTIYPPTVVALPILPLPIPSRVRPYKMVAQFEVDSLGNARLIGFNESRDSGYNQAHPRNAGRDPVPPRRDDGRATRKGHRGGHRRSDVKQAAARVWPFTAGPHILSPVS